jgi:hypothetical protein
MAAVVTADRDFPSVVLAVHSHSAQHTVYSSVMGVDENPSVGRDFNMILGILEVDMW